MRSPQLVVFRHSSPRPPWKFCYHLPQSLVGSRHVPGTQGISERRCPTASHLQLHVEMVWIWVPVLQASFSQRTVLGKLSGNLPLALSSLYSCQWPGEHLLGDKAQPSQLPCSSPVWAEVWAVPFTAWGRACPSEPGGFPWIWLCSCQLHDTEQMS